MKYILEFDSAEERDEFILAEASRLVGVDVTTAPCDPVVTTAAEAVTEIAKEEKAAKKRGRPKKAKGEGESAKQDKAVSPDASPPAASTAEPVSSPSPAASATAAAAAMKDDIPEPRYPLLGDVEVAVTKYHARFGMDAARALIQTVGEAEKYAQIKPENRAKFIKRAYELLEAAANDGAKDPA